MATEWQSAFPKFKIFDDQEVINILKKRSLDDAELFDRIRIPACKSDPARLVILHEYGGLYVDAHAGIGQLATLSAALEALSWADLIVFDRRDLAKTEGDTHLINSLLACRKGSTIINQIIENALKNLKIHELAEFNNNSHVEYNIYVLTGPWLISSTLLYLNSPAHTIKLEFQETLFKCDLASPMIFPASFYKYYSYRTPGTHWSERQKIERLFENRLPCK